VPLVLPPVVAGVALLTAFGRQGFIGSPLRDAFGVTIPFSVTAVVLAQVFVAMPFLVITVESSFRTADPTLDEEAAIDGASRWQTFRRINVPLALPGILSGAVLAWARAIGEFGATITFAGNAPGVTRTMPLEIYTALQTDPEPAIALSIVLLALSIVVLAALREKWLTNPWE
jgi:molybdate transport system permease protein